MYAYRNGLRTLTGILCIAVTIFIFTFLQMRTMRFNINPTI